MSQPGHATDWQSACIPPTIRRPWNVWENFLEDHVAEASSQAEEVTPEIREQIASVQAKGAKMAFLLLDESVQQQYIEVSYQELAAFANWRRSQVAQQESGAVPPATEFEGCWDLLNHDDKKEWLPQDPKAFLAADLQWAALVTNPLSGQEEADTEEVVWKDLLMTEAEDDSEVQGPLLTSDSEDHSEVSEDDAQQPGTPEFGRECKKLNADLKTHTARPEKADQQPLQMKTSESTEKERRMEERLQQLLESRKWLTVALDEAVGAVDNLELALQQQIQLTDLLQQLHRMQLEAAEQEFVNERMQYQQRLGDMEAQLAHQEQKFLASLAIAYGERDKERAELKAAKERRARELHEESLRTQIAHEEAAQLRREIAEVQSAREAADRSREAAKGKGKNSKGKYEDDSAPKGKGKGKSKYDDEPKGKGKSSKGNKGIGKSKSSGYEASYSYAPSGKGRSSDWSYQVRKGGWGKR